MHPPNVDTQTADALEQAIGHGNNDAWDKAVASRPVSELVSVLARRVAHATEQERIIIRNLVALAARRPALRGRINRELKSRHGARVPRPQLEMLRGFLGPDSQPTSASTQQWQRRVLAACERLGIRGRVREDVIRLELDEDVLQDSDPEDLPSKSSLEAKALAEQILALARPDRSRRRPLPAARRARLSLQAVKVLLLGNAPQDNQVLVLDAIGGYCARQAQSFTEDRTEPDVAQDWALEGVVYQSTNSDFPTALYFHTAIVRHLRETGGPSWSRFQGSDRPERILTAAVLGQQLPGSSPLRLSLALAVGVDLLRLAHRKHDTALVAFSGLQDAAAEALLEPLASLLGCTDRPGRPRERLERLLSRYQERLGGVVDFLAQGMNATTPRMIGALSAGLELAQSRAASLLWPREREALVEVNLSAAYTLQGDSAADPAVRRSLFNTAKTHLEKAAQVCRGLSFGLSHIVPVADHWSEVLRQGIDEARELIRPALSCRPYLYTYRRRGGQFEAQFQLRNDGQGMATAIEILACSSAGEPLDIEVEKNSLATKEEQLILVSGQAPEEGARLSVSLRMSCRDVEGNREEFPSVLSDLEGTPPGLDFEEERDRNPFNAGDVVKDPQMFYGRDGIIKQLLDVALAPAHKGALRLMFGQRRVGKSSILHFLERKLAVVAAPSTFCSHVTWLNFSQHRPSDVLFEIARQLWRASAARGCGDLPEPLRPAYERAYSVEFNQLLEALLERDCDSRVVILIDEFDKAYAQLTDPRLGFDETFFSYLRGMTTREGVTVVLAGGEETPAMLRDLGPTFNHARRVRVSYLAFPAVEALIRNPYVRWLDFPDSVVRALYRLGHGNPFFTQILCHEIVDRACRERAVQVSSRDVDQVARDIVALQLSVEQMAHLYEVGGRRDPLELAALYLLTKEAALGSVSALSLGALCSSIRASEGEVMQAVNRLVEREVLNNIPDKPGHVEVVMPLFAAWFRQVCPLTDDAWGRLRLKDTADA